MRLSFSKAPPFPDSYYKKAAKLSVSVQDLVKKAALTLAVSKPQSGGEPFRSVSAARAQFHDLPLRPRPSMETTKTRMSLKILVDKRNRTVLFAEAGKDFVDLLFHCLALPVGAIVSLLPKAGVTIGLRNLYESVESLNDTYIERKEKEGLLNAKSSSSSPEVLRFMLPEAPPLAPIDYYTCPGSNSVSTYGHYQSNNTCNTVTDTPSVKCPGCKNTMNKKLSWVAKPAADTASLAKVTGGEGGYVRGVVTYMVMDDLVIKPMSTISCITLLNRFNVHDMRDLEEKVIDFGLDEAIKLLTACLHSKTVLTDIFSGILKD